MRKIRYFSFNVAIILIVILLNNACDEAVAPTLTGVIRGAVVNSNNEPIPNVSISTDPATESVLTDSSGNFIIRRALEGELTVSARKTGYRSGTTNVRVYEGETTTVTLVLAAGGEGSVQADLTNPNPADGATEQAASLTLAWSPAGSGDIKYDVMLYDGGDVLSGRTIATGISDTAVIVENLSYNTGYLWQVNAYVDSSSKRSSPVWSFHTLRLPENMVFFSRSEDGNFNIYSFDQNNSVAYPLIRGGGHQTSPKLSPDLKQLAFAVHQNAEWHIYVADNQGNNPRKVTTYPIAGHHHTGREYSWKPNGDGFLYSHYNKLYSISENGTGLRVIATAPEGMNWRECDWTEQGGGKIVAVASGADIYDAEIYLMNEDGSNMQRIVENEPGILGSPVFSIDGKKILFTRDYAGYTTGSGSARQLDSRIFLLDLESGNRTDLSGNDSEIADSGSETVNAKPNGTNDLMPQFSPDGSRIIFVNARNTNTQLGQGGDIYTMKTNGADRRLLVRDGTTPSWD